MGTGEALNEHITGVPWPPAAQRQEMLEEAVTIIAELFTGEQLTHHGKYYDVDTARLHSAPTVPPPIYVSGFGESSRPTGRPDRRRVHVVGPQADLVKVYRDSGGGDRPVQGGLKGCWAPDTAEARQIWRSGADREYRTDFFRGRVGRCQVRDAG